MGGMAMLRTTTRQVPLHSGGHHRDARVQAQ